MQTRPYEEIEEGSAMANRLTTTKIGVPDLQAAADFYGSVLGMEVGGKFEAYSEWELMFPDGPRAALIIYDTAHGTLAHRPLGPSWLVFVVDDLKGITDRFRAAGVGYVSDPKRAPEFGVDYVITEDIFGNIIELSQFVS
jgi:catechol 2,3-dioxygenase-like lactoylglutathione lyase family enzyme